MATTAEKNYITFGLNPFKFIEDGLAIVEQNNLGIFMSKDRAIKSKIVSGKDYNWNGYKADSTLTFEQQFDINSGLGSFLDQSLLSKVDDIYANINAKLDLGGDIKPARIKFTDKPIGVFTFSQASKGLIRPVEYYSKTENKIIKPELVLKGSIANQDYYYYLLEGQEVIVQKRQEGTTEIIQNCKEAILQLNEQCGLYLPYDSDGKIMNQCEQYKLRYTSTNKKVYAYRQKSSGGIAPYVDLYIAIGGNSNLQPEQMLIRSIPNMLLARILEKSGVKVRIFAFGTGYDINIKRSMNQVLMVKNYGETIDMNKIAVFTSDTRFFRYYLFNANIGHNFKMTGDARSTPNTTSQNQPTTFNREILPMIRNYVKYQIEVGAFPSQVVNKKLMLFANIDVSSSDEISSKYIEKKIIEKFYSAIDYIQLQLSKNPRQIIQEIITREKSNGKSSYAIKQYLRDTVTDVMTPTSQLQKTSPAKLKEQYNKGKLTQEQYDEKLRVAIQLDSPAEADEIIASRKIFLDIIEALIP